LTRGHFRRSFGARLGLRPMVESHASFQVWIVPFVVPPHDHLRARNLDI
jgi:hypothetical protein